MGLRRRRELKEVFDVFAQLSVYDYIRIIAEITILTVVFYKFYMAISDTKATHLVGIVLVIGFLYISSKLLKLDVIVTMIETLALPFSMMLVVFYHPELRRAFSSSSFTKKRFFRGNQNSGEQIDSILNACNILVEKKRGALIVFPRHTDLKPILESGTRLNADLSSALILTIFDHDTPLHDGACVVQNGKITYAACYLPLSENNSIKATFGTRHRAALGLTESSDAVVIIVSEETGAISLAYNANINYDLESDQIKDILMKLLSFKDVTVSDATSGGSHENPEQAQ